jgi:prepilin-type N-terminal cleavage/methylation domain-containing protein
MTHQNPGSKRSRGFSLIEMLIVLAVIGIMASLIISSIAGAASETRNAVGRQQQVVIQEALNTWIAHQPGGIAASRTAYNNAGTSLARLYLIKEYIDKGTYDHLIESSSANKVQSDAMKRNKKYLALADWPAAVGGNAAAATQIAAYPEVRFLSE